MKKSSIWAFKFLALGQLAALKMQVCKLMGYTLSGTLITTAITVMVVGIVIFAKEKS